MSATFWLPLLLKAIATALLVVSASVAAERFGSVWGAIIASLPVSTGPAYVFLAMQHEPGFVASSALTSAVANAATGSFLITYGSMARRFAPWWCLAAAVAVWLGATVLLQQVHWVVWAAVGLNLGVYGVGLLFLGRAGVAEAGGARGPGRRWFELPVRAALVAAFVCLVVAASSALGPAVTGFVAVFPVSLISLIVILQRRLGGRATAGVAMNALAPMLGFGAMLLLLHLAIPLLGCVVWSGGLLLLRLYTTSQ